MTIDRLVSAQPLKREYSARDELETVTLVDAENQAIGAYGKIAAHRDGKLHRAFFHPDQQPRPGSRSLPLNLNNIIKQNSETLSGPGRQHA